MRPVDFFIRRTGAMFFDIAWVKRWMKDVIHLMAKKLEYTDEERIAYTKELELELQSVNSYQ